MEKLLSIYLHNDGNQLRHINYIPLASVLNIRYQFILFCFFVPWFHWLIQKLIYLSSTTACFLLRVPLATTPDVLKCRTTSHNPNIVVFIIHAHATHQNEILNSLYARFTFHNSSTLLLRLFLTWNSVRILYLLFFALSPFLPLWPHIPFFQTSFFYSWWFYEAAKF